MEVSIICNNGYYRIGDIKIYKGISEGTCKGVALKKISYSFYALLCV